MQNHLQVASVQQTWRFNSSAFFASLTHCLCFSSSASSSFLSSFTCFDSLFLFLPPFLFFFFPDSRLLLDLVAYHSCSGNFEGSKSKSIDLKGYFKFAITCACLAFFSFSADSDDSSFSLSDSMVVESRSLNKSEIVFSSSALTVSSTKVKY